jgi:hypothetical protein
MMSVRMSGETRRMQMFTSIGLWRSSPPVTRQPAGIEIVKACSKGSANVVHGLVGIASSLETCRR